MDGSYPNEDWEISSPRGDDSPAAPSGPDTPIPAPAHADHADAPPVEAPVAAPEWDAPPADYGEAPPDDCYDGPPPEYWDEPPPEADTGPRGKVTKWQRKPNPDDVMILTPAQAADVLHKVIVSTHGMTALEAKTLLQRSVTDRGVLDLLDEDAQNVYEKLAEGLTKESSLLPDGELLNLDHLDVRLGKPAWDLLCSIRHLTPVPNPHKALSAAIDTAQKQKAANSARRFADACTALELDATLNELFRKIEPPSRQESRSGGIDWLRSGDHWIEAANISALNSAQIRLSSGLPTLDRALTRSGTTRGEFLEPIGSFGPGEFWTIPAGTGHGKSAFARPLVTALAADLHAWGLPDAKVLIMFVEESADIILRAARVWEGMDYHYLSRNIYPANVGASRLRAVQAVYQLVMDAEDQAQATGRPITSFLPWVIVLDYIGGPKAQGETDATAIETNADLLLRGFAAWNPDDMALFTGLDYRTYSGRQWPEGMADFKPVVINFAQLLGKVGVKMQYQEGLALDEFAVENADGSSGWEVRPGDFFRPRQSHIRGSSVLVNHSTGVLFLHRSRPQSNPPVRDPNTGETHLVDTRARFIPDKVRNGASMTQIPMEFDSNPEGLRGMWYDFAAIRAFETGLLRDICLQTYTRRGDPMIPLRNRVSPFSQVW